MDLYPLKDHSNILDIDFSNMKSAEVKKYITSILNDEDCDHSFIIELLEKDNRKTVHKLSENVRKYVEDKEKEITRVKNMYRFDRKFLANGYIAGVDEVGRGPLAGPIVAAAVVLDLNCKMNQELILHINDSKKLSLKIREELDSIIKQKAISYSIAKIDNNEIDNKGIAWGNNEVLKMAYEGLNIEPKFILSDGYAIKNCKYNNEFVVKGDAQSASIACASIIAKVYRDNLMKEYACIYPQYDFHKNVGYGTKDHIDAIKKYGFSPIHRKSFLKNILNTF